MQHAQKLIEKERIKLRKAIHWKIFPALTVTLFLMLILLVYSSLQNSFSALFLVLTIVALLAGTVVFLLLTTKYRQDLRNGIVEVESQKVTKKGYELSYEPGSATVPVNILSIFFFRKLLKQEMKPIHSYYIFLGDRRLDLEKSEYLRIEEGQVLFLRWAPKSKMLLGLSEMKAAN